MSSLIKSIKNQAKVFGGIGFASGVVAPAGCQNLKELLAPYSSWSKEDSKIRAEAGKAWIAGWTEANLA